MSKNNAEAMLKAKAKRDQAAAEVRAAELEPARLSEKVRQTEAEAAANGVDLNALPSKQEIKERKQAAQRAAAAKRERKAAEAEKRKPTAQRIGEHLAENPVIPLLPPLLARRIPHSSAERMAAHLFEDGQLDRQADPSRNALPTGPFLRPTREVVNQPQWRGQGVRRVGQQRSTIPQTARSSLYKPWGSAPGQLAGVRQKAG